jgi:hypothetical protein
MLGVDVPVEHVVQGGAGRVGVRFAGGVECCQRVGEALVEDFEGEGVL